jgi:hypothetical protein
MLKLFGQLPLWSFSGLRLGAVSPLFLFPALPLEAGFIKRSE